MKSKFCFSFLAFLFLISIFSSAQQPVPAKAQSKPILLLNGTVHVGDGSLLKKAAIGFANGKITLLTETSKLSLDKSLYEVVDVTGKEIYPGFIAPNTVIGLSEIELVRSTLDFAETGNMNPNVRSIISYNTDSRVTPTIRTNGVLLAQIVPQGGTLSGSSSIVELDAWNWEDAAYKTDDGIHLNWPRMFLQRGNGAEPEDIQKANVEKEIQKIKAFFKDAKAYSLSSPSEKNIRFESMRGLFNGTKKIYIHCDFAKEIMTSVYFAKELGMQMVLVGGADSWRLTELLKENEIPIILGRTHSLPAREDDDVDMPYKLPSILKKAGIIYCLSVDGFWQVRNLPFMAGTSAEYGITKEEALMSVTSNTSKIFGIDKSCGTLEIGKDATLFVSSGDALDMKTNQVELAFIRGKKLELTNVQTALNKKFREKYGLK